VVFDAGRLAPSRPEGIALLAHELAHVVQASGTGEAAVVRRQTPDDEPKKDPKPLVRWGDYVPSIAPYVPFPGGSGPSPYDAPGKITDPPGKGPSSEDLNKGLHSIFDKKEPKLGLNNNAKLSDCSKLELSGSTAAARKYWTFEQYDLQRKMSHSRAERRSLAADDTRRIQRRDRVLSEGVRAGERRARPSRRTASRPGAGHAALAAAGAGLRLTPADTIAHLSRRAVIRGSPHRAFRGLDRQAAVPVRTEPVMKAASSEANYNAEFATSSGDPHRPIPGNSAFDSRAASSRGARQQTQRLRRRQPTQFWRIFCPLMMTSPEALMVI
jgi:hypothetical protein